MNRFTWINRGLGRAKCAPFREHGLCLASTKEFLYSLDMFRVVKRFFYVSVMGIFLAASTLPLLAQSRRPPLPHEPMTVVLDGQIRTDMETVTVEDVPCLSLSGIQKLFGGKQSWRRISRQVSYEVFGRSADFTLDSATATVLGQEVPLEVSVRFWTGQVYIPLSFLKTKEFQDLTGNTIRWDPTTRSLSVEPVPSVSSPQLHSLGYKSKVIVEISPRVNYRVMDRRSGHVFIRFFGGRSDRSETLETKDGLIESIRMTSIGRRCDMEVMLSSAAAPPQIRLVESPRRVVVDVAAKVAPSKEEPVSPSLPVPSAVTSVPVPPLPSIPETPSVDVVPSIPAAAPAMSALSPIKTIVIDAGHGGKDTGALGPRGTLEKDINLVVARALAQVLRRDRRFQVILTRDSDEFIPLQERTEIANKQKADLFVSVHCNAALSKRSSGFEIYFLSENATDDVAASVARRENAVIELEGVTGKTKHKIQELLWSMARTETMNESSEVAGLISQQAKQKLPIHSRGVKQANFYVLRGADMPAVLVESGFITHSQEELQLRSDRFQNKLVNALYSGILEYEKRKIHSRQSKAAVGG
jgi:N-acetylmuramoyl-L-alanine amidase